MLEIIEYAQNIADSIAVFRPMMFKGIFMSLLSVVMLALLSWKFALITLGFLFIIGLVLNKYFFEVRTDR